MLCSIHANCLRRLSSRSRGQGHDSVTVANISSFKSLFATVAGAAGLDVLPRNGQSKSIQLSVVFFSPLFIRSQLWDEVVATDVPRKTVRKTAHREWTQSKPLRNIPPT